MGTGDFNGDAKTNIAWQNASTGQVYVWLMDGTTLASHGAVFTLGDPNWVLAGTGDYDGNGKDDLLWRNSSTGENYLWFMNGSHPGFLGCDPHPGRSGLEGLGHRGLRRQRQGRHRLAQRLHR